MSQCGVIKPTSDPSLHVGQRQGEKRSYYRRGHAENNGAVSSFHETKSVCEQAHRRHGQTRGAFFPRWLLRMGLANLLDQDLISSRHHRSLRCLCRYSVESIGLSVTCSESRSVTSLAYYIGLQRVTLQPSRYALATELLGTALPYVTKSPCMFPCAAQTASLS